MTDFTVRKKPFWKIGNGYTNKQYSSKGKEFVNNVEVVRHLLCDLTDLSFMNGLLITDYLSAWMENQSQTPNDRCAFKNNI